MKITIAELRRRLPVGATFKASFLRGPIKVVGNTGNTLLPVDNNEYSRVVVKQTASEMVSKYTEGPREGREVTCTWRAVVAREEEGRIILTHTDQSRNEDFLAIVL